MARVLKPGGTVIIGEYYTPQYGYGYVDWIADSGYSNFGLRKEIYTNGQIQNLLAEQGIGNCIQEVILNSCMKKDSHVFFMTLTKNPAK